MTVPDQQVPENPTAREAALAALAESGLDESNWPVDESQEDESEEVTDEDTDTEAVEEEAATSDETEEDESEEDDSVPTEWFGVDLSGFPSEKRAEIIEAFKEQDRYAQSLSQKLKEKEGEPPQEEEEPEAVAELDDDQLMEALGVPKDDPMYDVKKEIMAPMARVMAQQQQVVQQLQEREAEEQFIQWWETGLDEMEAQFGPLSIDREDLAQIALKEGLRSPQEAYARVALSGRKTVEDLVKKAKEGVQEKARKKKPSTQRPRSDSAASKPEAKKMTPAEAAEAAMKSTGFDWGEALKGVT